MTAVPPVTITDVMPKYAAAQPGTRIAVVVPLNFPDFTEEAVGEVAPDLTVAARGLDGAVEAVEHRDPHCWVLGVQWHPEDSDGPSHSREVLFGALLAAANDYRAYQSACRTG